MLTYNNTYDGPFDLECLVSPATSQYARTGIKNEALTVIGNFEQKEQILGDGSKVYWLEGLELIVEVILSEVDPVATTGDLVKIKASNLATLTFTDPTRIMTLGTGGTMELIKTDLLENGMKITMKQSGYIGQDWVDMFTMPVGA